MGLFDFLKKKKNVAPDQYIAEPMKPGDAVVPVPPDSPFGHLNFKDLLHGCITAFGTSLFGGLILLIGNVVKGEAAFSSISLTNIALLGVAAAIAYLNKKLFTNSENKFGKKEPK